MVTTNSVGQNMGNANIFSRINIGILAIILGWPLLEKTKSSIH